MKYEYCVFLGEFQVSRIFETLEAAMIQLGILMVSYKEIDPKRWHIACREVSDWRFKDIE